MATTKTKRKKFKINDKQIVIGTPFCFKKLITCVIRFKNNEFSLNLSLRKKKTGVHYYRLKSIRLHSFTDSLKDRKNTLHKINYMLDAIEYLYDLREKQEFSELQIFILNLPDSNYTGQITIQKDNEKYFIEIADCGKAIGLGFNEKDSIYFDFFAQLHKALSEIQKHFVQALKDYSPTSYKRIVNEMWEKGIENLKNKMKEKK